MEFDFKKYCACGALAAVISTSSPLLCDRCFLEIRKHPDLPANNSSTTTSFSTRTVFINDVQDTSSTTTAWRPLPTEGLSS